MTDLTDRMRTCAEFLQTCDLLGDLELRNDVPEYKAVHNAIELLREAADTLEAAGVGLVKMDTQTAVALGIVDEAEEELLRQIKHPVMPAKGGGVWLDPGVPDLPTQPLSRNACPNCDSRGSKFVRVRGKTIELECPVCGHAWKR